MLLRSCTVLLCPTKLLDVFKCLLLSVLCVEIQNPSLMNCAKITIYIKRIYIKSEVYRAYFCRRITGYQDFLACLSL